MHIDELKMQIYSHLCTVQMAQSIWTIFHFLNQDLEMLQNADCNRFQIKTLGECVKKLFKCVECTCVFKTG